MKRSQPRFDAEGEEGEARLAPTGELILGIDPGLASTGYGLLEDGDQVVAHGSIRTEPGPPGSRLLLIVRELEGLLSRHPVREAALEELFMGRNRTSVIGVAQARGVVLLALEMAGIPTFEYTPAKVKSVVTGYGMADKAQVARMLALQLREPLVGRANDHAADAIAVAICHARSHRLEALASR